MNREDFEAELAAAFRPASTPSHVRLDSAEGAEFLLYDDDPAFTLGGMLFIPASVMDTIPE
jgi:hypothetical protein